MPSPSRRPVGRVGDVLRGGTAARIVPTLALALAGGALAWFQTGSIDAGDWLPYAFLAGLLLAVVVGVGGAVRPLRLELVVLAALVLLAGWEALSLSWSAAPSLARDEALLTLFYAIAFAVPLVSLRKGGERLAAVSGIAAVSAVLAVGSALALWLGTNQVDHYYSGRLSYPISYPNALAAVFLVGLWPAVLLAARRESPVVVRSLALGGGVAASAGWLQTQSKGGALGIAVSAVILFAVSPLRLRLLVPALLTAALTAAASVQLTAPFRAHGQEQLVHTIKHAGAALLVVTAAGIVVGLLYALADRRLELAVGTRRALALASLALLCAGAVVAVAAFFVRVDHPIGYAQSRWRDFKHVPAQETTSTHLLTLGSYRYDVWRVALGEFRRHPLAGIGARGFGAAYLQHRRSSDTPGRAHSLWLDALSELGIVGFLLLLAALAPPLAVLLAGTRARDPAATAALGGAGYWLAHASVDWLWTVPACGIGFWLLLGLGRTAGERRPLGARAGLVTALGVGAVAVVAFVPPWLSARLSMRALSARDPAADVRWAKRLDPLSVDPYVSEAARAPSARGAAVALGKAVRKEPRIVELRYDLGLAYLRAHELRRARTELLEAKQLDPLEPRIAVALRRTR